MSGSVRRCVCVLISVKCECVELPFILQICKTRKKSAKNACVANNRKLLQQKEKTQKRQAKDTKSTRKSTETQNKWQLHKRNRNEEKIKVTGVLTRKIANLHQKRCLQQADSNTRPPRNYVTKKPWTSDLARVTLRQQKGEKEEEERRTKHTSLGRTKPN